MSRAKPNLEVVEGGAGAGHVVESPSSASGGRRHAVVVAWALAGLLALSVLGMAQQGRRAQRLTARVAGLEAALAASEAALEAHRGHLDDVREAVSELQELVGRDPAPMRRRGSSGLP